MLEAVEIENFRCIRHAHLEFDPRATAICGDNASGKTSLLEALYFLGQGRSFRTANREHLLTREASFMRVVGRCRTGTNSIILGAEWSDGTTKLRLAGRPVRSAIAMAEALPLQVIDPGVHRVIEEGSARRRRLLDWGVFHVKHDFIAAWRRYHRALEQRNALLRTGAGADAMAAWDFELAAAGTALHSARLIYIGVLAPYLSALSMELLNQPIQMDYHAGWSQERTLAEALEAARARDLRAGFTTVGAHRADLRFKHSGQLAKDRVSRGEQKMLAITFILAQIRCLAEITKTSTCLLVDDPAAELDVDNLGKLLRAIEQLPGQLVITSVDAKALTALSIGRMFHVKQGLFHPVL